MWRAKATFVRDQPDALFNWASVSVYRCAGEWVGECYACLYSYLAVDPIPIPSAYQISSVLRCRYVTDGKSNVLKLLVLYTLTFDSVLSKLFVLRWLLYVVYAMSVCVHTSATHTTSAGTFENIFPFILKSTLTYFQKL